MCSAFALQQEAQLLQVLLPRPAVQAAGLPFHWADGRKLSFKHVQRSAYISTCQHACCALQGRRHVSLGCLVSMCIMEMGASLASSTCPAVLWLLQHCSAMPCSAVPCSTVACSAVAPSALRCGALLNTGVEMVRMQLPVNVAHPSVWCMKPKLYIRPPEP